MMTPTLVLEDGRPRLALGSAGSVRLAGAIVQVVDAVDRRCERDGGDRRAALPRRRRARAPSRGRLAADHRRGAPGGPWEVIPWQSLNLFFGGVSAVELRADGTLEAAGDPRRGGHGIVV